MTAATPGPVSSLLGPAGHDYGELAACLRSFAGEDVVFVPNPGNAGDALINLGMYHLFDAIGLSPRTGTLDDDYTGKVIIYSGGGALISAYKDADRFFHRTHRQCKALILLPHTVRAYPELLAAMDDRCHLFAREQASFDYLRAHCTNARVALSHDMAFFLDDRSIAAERFDGPFMRDRNRWWIWSKMITKLAWQARGAGSVLNAFRTDVEATDIPVPARNHDMSELFASGNMSRGACSSTIRAMRMVMRRYDLIETNRLHVAVLAGLIGRPVNMRDNSYGKNRAIYDRSIDGYYGNVRFMAD